MRKRKQHRRRLIERLEARQMLAGNVTVQLVNGDLIVTGDGEDNRIGFSSWNNFQLQALPDAAGVPTSINGQPTGSFDYSSVSGNVVVRMLDGNDRVDFQHQFPGALVIEGGNGNDFVGSEAAATIGAELIIDTGPGTNTIRVEADPLALWSAKAVVIGTSLIVRGGSGADDVRFRQLQVANDIVINAAGGSDQLSVQFSTVGNFFGIDGGPNDYDVIGAGNITARVVSFRSGGGAGEVGLGFSKISGDVGLIGGEGPARITLNYCIVNGTSYLVSGSANDRVESEFCLLNELQVNTGDGLDRVDINGSIVQRVFAELGADGDLMVMNNDVIQGEGSLSGGTGFDVFFGRGNSFGRASTAFFELFT